MKIIRVGPQIEWGKVVEVPWPEALMLPGHKTSIRLLVLKNARKQLKVHRARVLLKGARGLLLKGFMNKMNQGIYRVTHLTCDKNVAMQKCILYNTAQGIVIARSYSAQKGLKCSIIYAQSLPSKTNFALSKNFLVKFFVLVLVEIRFNVHE